ncbi:hypothetical protein SAM23877_1700 [Streptomyces ambofaciens ATCC 23877]|uniref:Uncharacterized protein n=1 Tax=Streptomyces ambofaciens (strain ATCC 23877 / 3486 / DSM 40053 / JCM 4204 / NBRC 12836 / NRRL B-2516) TaxID=278992 RepID=A0A0K2AP41_STRA7|nr:hypothetical protein SAM23877_1700 [Streptomyces ambofaciens ATCC 23877]
MRCRARCGAEPRRARPRAGAGVIVPWFPPSMWITAVGRVGSVTQLSHTWKESRGSQHS